MHLTLLFDLDDTLLNTNIAEFVPAYFQALSKHLARWVQPDVMLKGLMSGTQQMLANEDPATTLQEVFERDFYPRLGISKDRISDAIEDFYDNVFRSLGSVTSTRNGAVELVDWAIEQGFRIAIATDPLFPKKAVYERIRWAGLDPESFELISSYETFHFTKSHPAYYAELLGRLGWPDGPVLMVGNDEERDLRRALELGVATYQVVGEPAIAQGGSATSAGTSANHGSLTDLRHWLESTDPNSLEPQFKQRAAVLAILRSTPAVLQSLTTGVQPAEWRNEPSPEDWALIEIICHLRDTEREVHHEQLQKLKSEAQPFVPRPDAAVWAKQRHYLDENGAEALAGFTTARIQTLTELADLGDEIWRRPARHAIFGPTDFAEVVGFMADHDRLHIQQAWRTLGSAG